jgi:hypothetical protein
MLVTQLSFPLSAFLSSRKDCFIWVNIAFTEYERNGSVWPSMVLRAYGPRDFTVCATRHCCVAQTANPLATFLLSGLAIEPGLVQSPAHLSC